MSCADEDGLRTFSSGVSVIWQSRENFVDYKEFIIEVGVMWKRFRKSMAQRKLKFLLESCKSALIL